MIPKQQKNSLKIYIRSFGENSIERAYSKRLLYIMGQKSGIIDIEILDVNQEMASVFSSERQHTDWESILVENFGIIRNREFGAIEFPQVFLTTADSQQHYLGGYYTI